MWVEPGNQTWSLGVETPVPSLTWTARLLLVIVVVTSASCAALGSPTEPDAARERWRRADESPLSPRQRAVVVTIGPDVLAVGGDGSAPCPPGADCLVEPSARADGAILDVGSSTWRRTAEATVAVLDATAGVVGDAVHVWDPDATDGGALLVYDVGDDRWEQLPHPEEVSDGYELTATDDLVVLAPRHDGGGDPPSFALAPASETWSTLPPDPLPPLYERSLVWTGSDLVLLGAEAAPDADAPDPSLVIAAAFDTHSGSWRRLPDSEIVAGHGREWVGESGLVVAPSPGTVDGGAVNNWGRDHPLGGILDPRAATWASLPSAPSPHSPRVDPMLDLGRPVGGEGYVTGHGGMLLDIRARSWVEPPTNPAMPNVGASSAWADGRLVLFGGARWDGAEATLSNETWIWEPPTNGRPGER